MSASVPCNGCKACCKKELILLHPDKGDDYRQYDTTLVHNPLTGLIGHALRHQPNGDCIYLGPHGCTIHGRAPIICREFDCRRWFQKSSTDMRKLAINQEMVAAARKRLPSLRIEERAGK